MCVHWAIAVKLTLNMPFNAVFCVLDNNFHLFKLVTDSVGCRPILFGTGFCTLCNKLLNLLGKVIASVRFVAFGNFCKVE